MGLKRLTTEQQLVVLLSRITFSDEDEREIKELANKKVNWYTVYNYSIKNKVAPLVYRNLVKRGYKEIMPYELARIVNFYYHGTVERNKVLMKEMDIVLQKLQKEGIKCSPLKGAYLIPCLYSDLGIRTVHDIDCMIEHKDAQSVVKIMESLGYSQGDYDPVKKEIKSLNRETQILWKMKMNNLYPFKKIDHSGFADLKVFDFSFSLDLELDKQPVHQMMSDLYFDEEFGYPLLKPAHFLIHLCCHLYKEATTAVFIMESNDLNLIKFCDVREFILRKMTKEDLDEAISFAQEYHIENAIYYTVYYLKEIYNDGYEADLLNQLKIKDEEFLHHYGHKDFTMYKKWQKSFWERLFAFNNSDELDEVPKYMKLNT